MCSRSDWWTFFFVCGCSKHDTNDDALSPQSGG